MMFCKHDWEIVVNETMPSKLDELISKGAKSDKIPVWMLEKKKIIILKCNKCGALNKTVVEN